MNRKKTWLSAALCFGMTVLTAFENPQQAVDASSKAMKEKNYAEAHKCLEEGFKLCVNPTEKSIVLTRHAELYKTQRDFANAEKMLRQIIDDDKMTPQLKASAWLNIARYKEFQKKSEDAVEAYQNALEYVKEGNQAQDALIRCGLSMANMKDYTGAIECYKKVMETPNKDEKRSLALKKNAYMNLAKAYASMNKYSDSVKILDGAAALPEYKSEKDQKEFKNTLYRLYEIQIRDATRFRKFDEAEAALAELKKRDDSPRTAGMETQLFRMKATAMIRAKKADEAEKLYRKGLEVKNATTSDLCGIYGDLINFYISTGKSAEAEKELQAMLKLPCQNAEERFVMNDSHRRYLCSVKKYDEAIKLMDETAKVKGLSPARVARCFDLACGICLSKNDVKTALLYKEKAEKVPGANWKASAYLKKKLGL